MPEVYAQEAIFLHDQPRRELKLQAFRIGDLGITAIPNEVFAITGLKLKAQSPFDLTMNIELANGSEGYIPPPEQHALGGYTTWPARTAALEVDAEPKIVEALLSLLEKVASRPRRTIRLPSNRYADAIMNSQPQAYWRLDDIAGKSALDSTPHAHHAPLEPGFALYLPGVDTPGLRAPNSLNRCVHFAGGRLKTKLRQESGDYSVELWFWNGLTPDAPLVGTPLFAREAKTGDPSSGDQVGIAALPGKPGKLYFSCFDAAERLRSGKTTIAPKTWHHLALVRQGKRITLYLDGSPEIDGDFEQKRTAADADLVVGGSFVGKSGFEGKIDEVAVFNRSLTAQEISAHYAAAH